MSTVSINIIDNQLPQSADAHMESVVNFVGSDGTLSAIESTPDRPAFLSEDSTTPGSTTVYQVPGTYQLAAFTTGKVVQLQFWGQGKPTTAPPDSTGTLTVGAGTPNQ